MTTNTTKPAALCLTCGVITDYEYDTSPSLSRLRDWQDKLSAFYGQYPLIWYVIRTPLLWLSLAIICAFLEETRELTPVFVILAVVVGVMREKLPLAPVPFDVNNTVTSRCDSHMTAAYTLLYTAMGLAFVGVFVLLSERLGNISVAKKSGYTRFPPSYWGVEPLPWITSYLLVAPLVYFSSLALSSRFVNPRVESFTPMN